MPKLLTSEIPLITYLMHLPNGTIGCLYLYMPTHMTTFTLIMKGKLPAIVGISLQNVNETNIHQICEELSGPHSVKALWLENKNEKVWKVFAATCNLRNLQHVHLNGGQKRSKFVPINEIHLGKRLGQGKSLQSLWIQGFILKTDNESISWIQKQASLRHLVLAHCKGDPETIYKGIKKLNLSSMKIWQWNNKADSLEPFVGKLPELQMMDACLKGALEFYECPCPCFNPASSYMDQSWTNYRIMNRYSFNSTGTAHVTVREINSTSELDSLGIYFLRPSDEL